MLLASKYSGRLNARLQDVQKGLPARPQRTRGRGVLFTVHGTLRPRPMPSTRGNRGSNGSPGSRPFLRRAQDGFQHPAGSILLGGPGGGPGTRPDEPARLRNAMRVMIAQRPRSLCGLGHTERNFTSSLFALRLLHAAGGRANPSSVRGHPRVLERTAYPEEPTKKMAPWQTAQGPLMVEARGIEPLSEDLQRIGPTCLADRLVFATAHAHRQA